MKPFRCQASKKESPWKHVKERFLALSLAVFSMLAFTGGVMAKNADDIPDYLFIGKKVPNKIPLPPAPQPDHAKVIVPPGEQQYFPVRADGQPYILNIDRTVNLTEAMNRMYYNPKWRGEEWTPFDQVDNIERASRLMGTWREYDEANIYRVFTPVNKFIEKYSGYGP
jgi:hypothetical protein